MRLALPESSVPSLGSGQALWTERHVGCGRVVAGAVPQVFPPISSVLMTDHMPIDSVMALGAVRRTADTQEGHPHGWPTIMGWPNMTTGRDAVRRAV